MRMFQTWKTPQAVKKLERLGRLVGDSGDDTTAILDPCSCEGLQERV